MYIIPSNCWHGSTRNRTALCLLLAFCALLPTGVFASPAQKSSSPRIAEGASSAGEAVVASSDGFGTPGNHGCCEIVSKKGNTGVCKKILGGLRWDCEAKAADPKEYYQDCQGDRPWSNLQGTVCESGLSGQVEVCKEEGDPCVIGTYSSEGHPHQKCIHYDPPKEKITKDRWGNVIDALIIRGECISATSEEATY